MNFQNWERFYVDVDKLYEGFLTGCALSGPTGCPISTAPNQTAADVDAEVQRVLKLAHDAAFANASAPLTSGQLRCTYFHRVRHDLDALLMIACLICPGDAGTAEIHSSLYFAINWTEMSASWPKIVSTVEGESTPSNFTKRVSYTPPFQLDFMQRR